MRRIAEAVADGACAIGRSMANFPCAIGSCMPDVPCGVSGLPRGVFGILLDTRIRLGLVGVSKGASKR
jgi:hypothetical protein